MVYTVREVFFMKLTGKKLSEKLKKFEFHWTKKKIIALVILLIALVLIGLFCWWLAKPMIRMANDPDMFRAYMKAKGLPGILAFIGATILQVVAAIIPGGPFEIAAGYAFGAFRGALISDIGTTTGSMLVFLIVKKYGRDVVEVFFSKEQIDSVSFLKTTDRFNLIAFFLYVIPGTPKDLITYFLGLTDMKWTTMLIITFIGRFPAILMSTLGGNAIGEQRYMDALLVLVLIGIFCAGGTLVYRKMQKKHSAKKSA